MNQEPEWGSKEAGTEPTAPSARDTTTVTKIDFHTPEFNVRDGLDNFSLNYRSFEPLGDIVTADMRHQRERRLTSAADDERGEGGMPREKMISDENVEDSAETAPPLTVVSHGRVLIIDTDPERAVACGQLLSGQGLSSTLLVVGSKEPETSLFPQGPLTPREVNGVSITGAFGGFSAAVAAGGTQKPLTGWLGTEAATFDLVLDLQPSPSYDGGCLPLGYYAPGPRLLNLDEVMAELSEMKGQFTKPQFTIFQKDRCLHGRSRTHDCRLCVEVCPVAAIQTDKKTISVNHYLCQGCGGCALVCPAEAIRMAHPSRGEVLSDLLNKMAQEAAEALFPLTLVISDKESVRAAYLPGTADGGDDRRISFPVEQIGYAGLDVVLSALASGADRVIVGYGENSPPKIVEALARQAKLAAAILEGIGIPADRIRFVEIPSDGADYDKVSFPASESDDTPRLAPTPKTALSPQHDKRTLVRLATQYLYDQSGRQQPWFPLPAGSPFGAVTVDAHCTLCMACAFFCPTGALRAGGDWPQLSFRESFCHQCGLCEETCPEGAIHLLPRMLYDLKAADTPVVLREAEPFRCIECGAPFASQNMINRIRDKLAGHWMYSDDRQLRRLQMCGTCRARDALTSQDMKSWNLR